MSICRTNARNTAIVILWAFAKLAQWLCTIVSHWLRCVVVVASQCCRPFHCTETSFIVAVWYIRNRRSCVINADTLTYQGDGDDDGGTDDDGVSGSGGEGGDNDDDDEDDTLMNGKPRIYMPNLYH